jgi:hypothetical protein
LSFHVTSPRSDGHHDDIALLLRSEPISRVHLDVGSFRESHVMPVGVLNGWDRANVFGRNFLIHLAAT